VSPLKEACLIKNVSKVLEGMRNLQTMCRHTNDIRTHMIGLLWRFRLHGCTQLSDNAINTQAPQ